MNKIKVFNKISDFVIFRKALLGTIGFVPTMGALHDGHRTLLERSIKENTNSVLSIYVNPTQFNNTADLEKYPKTLEDDLKLAESIGITAVFSPEYSEIYPDNFRFKLTETEFSKTLCGQHRPGHFDGVLTIVMKLLNIIQADHAYFGEKDFQQLQLIKNMCDAFFMKTKIHSEKTVRETSGLAMSSRNQRLSADGKIKAALIYKLLKDGKTIADIKNNLLHNGFEIDYIEEIYHRRLAAVTLEGVRLIDNVEIK